MDEKNRQDLLSVEGAAPADIVTANFSVCTTAGSSEGCPQSAWEDISRTAGSRRLRRVGACILAKRDEGRALSSLRVSMPSGRAYFAFLEKAPKQVASIAPLRVMEIPSAARFRESVRFEIGRCLVDPVGRVRNVHEKQSFEASLIGGEVAGIAGSFVSSKIIWTAHASNGTTRQTAFPLNEPFGALPFVAIGFPFDTTSSLEWVDAKLEVRFPSGETIVLEEAGGCRLSPWRASVAKADVSERDLGFMARGSARTLEELGIDRTAPGLNDERIRYAYSFGPTAPDAGERWFADGASCLTEKGWKEIRDGVVSFLAAGRFGLSIRACNPAGGSAAPWTFRATVSSSVPDFALAWIDLLQLAPVPTIGSFRAPVPFEVRDLRDDVLPWNSLAASARCHVYIIDRSPVNKTSLSCSLQPDRRLRVLNGRVNFDTQGLTDADFQSWVGRRLRIVVSVGTDEVDKRERFLEAEIPRYVLQGYVPVVDILPDAARRMDICGTTRADDGAQYALMADGSVLHLATGDDHWELFATMSSQKVAFTNASEGSRLSCPSYYEFVSWSPGVLLVTPNKVKVDEFEASINSVAIPELCESGKCNPLFSTKNGSNVIRVLVRNESTVAALLTDGTMGATHRLVSRTIGQAEVETDIAAVDPVGARSNPDLKILHNGEFLIQFPKNKLIYSPVSTETREVPRAFLDKNWEDCRSWPTSAHFTCSSANVVRVQKDGSFVDISVIESQPEQGTDFHILAVETSSEAVFVSFVWGEDVFVRKFDFAGKSLWLHPLFKWKEGPFGDIRKYPVLFSLGGGRLIFQNARCQSFAFDDAGFLANSDSPLGIGNDGEFSCAYPMTDRGQLVYVDPTFGKLRAAKNEAITWNQIDPSYDSNVVWIGQSSLFRILSRERSSGRDRAYDLNTFDEHQATFALPDECLTGFEGLAACQSELSKVPVLSAESISLIVYGKAHSLGLRIVESPDSEKNFYMFGTYIHLTDEERLIHASRNGVLLVDSAQRLVFMRVGADGSLIREIVSTSAASWKKRIRDAGAVKTATFGRVSLACADSYYLQDCLAWTDEGIIGDLNKIGSAFSPDERTITDFQFIYVAGWSGIGMSINHSDGRVIGMIVFNDEGQLTFVERMRVHGDESDFNEAIGGEFVYVGEQLLSRVHNGVWEVGSEKSLLKRTRNRNRKTLLIPDVDRGNPVAPYVGASTSAFESQGAHGWNVIVLPHLAFE